MKIKMITLETKHFARIFVLGLIVTLVFAFVVITYVNWLDKDIPVIRILAWVIAVLALGVTFLAAAVWWKGWWGLAAYASR